MVVRSLTASRPLRRRAVDRAQADHLQAPGHLQTLTHQVRTLRFIRQGEARTIQQLVLEYYHGILVSIGRFHESLGVLTRPRLEAGDRAVPRREALRVPHPRLPHSDPEKRSEQIYLRRSYRIELTIWSIACIEKLKVMNRNHEGNVVILTMATCDGCIDNSERGSQEREARLEHPRRIQRQGSRDH
jgi:hypothetical protein